MLINPRVTVRHSAQLATEALPLGGDACAEVYSVTRVRRIRYAAAVLSLVAGAVHLWGMPHHYAEWWGYGAFFLVVALGQVLLSDGLLYRPRRRLFLMGIVGNLAVITVYLATRSVGIPLFGPHAGDVEGIGVVDLAATIVESALVIGLVTLTRISSPFEPSVMGRARPPGGLREEDVER